MTAGCTPGDGISHTVEVTAAILYEAGAQGLAAIRCNKWVAGVAQGQNVVKVSVTDVQVEHEVELIDFTKWLDKTGGLPREVSDRRKIRSRRWAGRLRSLAVFAQHCHIAQSELLPNFHSRHKSAKISGA
jgi:hypothetical protein